MVSRRDVTALLGDWSRGDRTALNELLPLVYAELRRVAARQLGSERTDHILQPAALVHEVFHPARRSTAGRMAESAHSFGAAAKVMRRILVDHGPSSWRAQAGRGVCAVCPSMKPRTFGSARSAHRLRATSRCREKPRKQECRAWLGERRSKAHRSHCSLACSTLACLKTGTSGSASFQRARRSL